MADGSITTLMTSGADAFNNLYDILITAPTGIDDNQTSMSVRSMGFTPPELNIGEYQAKYKGVTITRPNAKIEGERKFTIDLRMDADYEIIKYLTKWKNKVVIPDGEGEIIYGSLSSSTLGSTADAVTGSVAVNVYRASTSLSEIADAEATPIMQWKFYNVICVKIGAPAFSRGSSDPTKITAEFMFMDYDGPNTVDNPS